MRGNGDAISYLYDQGKRNTGIEALNAANAAINKYVYDYNKIHLKNFEKKEHKGEIYDLYSYDALSRLKDVTFNADNPTSPTTFDKKKSLEFDKIDNIMNLVTTDSAGAELQSFSGEVNNLNQYTTFDQWGLTHDLNGNTTQKGTQNFTYDYRNQLVSVSGEGSGVTFKYDVLGRRIEKEIGAGTTKYYYSKNQVIEERDGTDTVTKQFIYGNGIDEALRMDRNESGTMVSYYYHTNGTGSITAITDSTGNLVERIDYDIYGMPTFTDFITDPGNPTVVSNSVIGNEYLFQGRRYDTESNLYYYRARYYDPIMGRFLQTDPMGYKDSMNLYQAFNMNGVNYLDPFGEFIYLTGDDKTRKASFIVFKEAMRRMGVSNIDNIIEMENDAKGTYIKLQVGENIQFSTLSDKKSNVLKNWTKNKSRLSITENFSNYIAKAFTDMLRDKNNHIELMVSNKPFRNSLWTLTLFGRKIPDNYGAGACLEPNNKINDSKYNNVQIHVKEKLYEIEKWISPKGSKGSYREKWIGEKIPMNIFIILVHELGHAYAYSIGEKQDATSHDTVNADLAVFFENFYRLISNIAKNGGDIRQYH